MSDCKPIDNPGVKGENLYQEMCPKTQDEIEKMARVLLSFEAPESRR